MREWILSSENCVCSMSALLFAGPCGLDSKELGALTPSLPLCFAAISEFEKQSLRNLLMLYCCHARVPQDR